VWILTGNLGKLLHMDVRLYCAVCLAEHNEWWPERRCTVPKSFHILLWLHCTSSHTIVMWEMMLIWSYWRCECIALEQCQLCCECLELWRGRKGGDYFKRGDLWRVELKLWRLSADTLPPLKDCLHECAVATAIQHSGSWIYFYFIFN